MSIATQYPQEYIERLKRDFLREVHPYNQMLDRIQMYKPVSILVTHEGVIITNSNVHQLQNIFFALTGEELTIKETEVS